jgi:hypothetical protein
MTEAQIQDAIRLELGTIPGLVLWRNNVGSAERRGVHIKFGVGGAGGADLIGVFHGRFVAVEIKTAIGRQSPEQRTFQQLVERKGGEYVLLRSAEAARAWAMDFESRHSRRGAA